MQLITGIRAVAGRDAGVKRERDDEKKRNDDGLIYARYEETTRRRGCHRRRASLEQNDIVYASVQTHEIVCFGGRRFVQGAGIEQGGE